MRTEHHLEVIAAVVENNNNNKKRLNVMVRDVRCKRTIVEVPLFTTYGIFKKAFLELIYDLVDGKVYKIKYNGCKTPFIARYNNGVRELKFRREVERLIRKAIINTEKLVTV